ncbi:hypothetical protein [Nakamurella deserti]|uniref:hypothetical protein n=1 Tax=Nakamurella deserti TaxID=2164074 RepID=UPI000DBE5850|nr:hypothetical protein [Nakamurella deserti]
MTHDRDPFDGPSPVGPLGAAMARLTEDAPPAGFTESTIRYHLDNGRSLRRQVFGGIAAAAAAIAVLVLFVSTLGRGGDATSAASTSMASTSSSSAAANAAPSAGSSSASSAGGASSGGAAAPSAGSSVPGSFGVPTAAPGQLPDDASAGGGQESADTTSCRPAPLDETQLQAVESVLGGATRLDSCALADADLGVQRYAVAGGSVVVERRAGSYDPCAGTAGATCTDVPGRPGVRTAELGGVGAVWISGRDGSVVLTADPAGAVPVDTLAAAAEALAAVAP